MSANEFDDKNMKKSILFEMGTKFLEICFGNSKKISLVELQIELGAIFI